MSLFTRFAKVYEKWLEIPSGFGLTEPVLFLLSAISSTREVKHILIKSYPVYLMPNSILSTHHLDVIETRHSINIFEVMNY